MKRREFIAGLGGVAAWPLAVRAQQGDRVRRIGVLMGWDENDREARAYVAGLTQGLSELGWTVGRNLRMRCSRCGKVGATAVPNWIERADSLPGDSRR